MLRRRIFTIIVCCPLLLAAQYKNDNVAFKTVDVVDLCASLSENSKHLLLDVRSKGENSDTSSFPGLNIGHLKGARNIDIRELGNRITEIAGYKDQPVYVYCSHSQRSRRASKMLADSGFTRVYNINGGLTALYNNDDCITQLINSNNKYQIISPKETCRRIKMVKNYFLLDVRSDSAFRWISTDHKANGLGYLKGSLNIPVNELEGKLSMVPKDRPILVTDLYGSDAAKAATLLANHGFTNVAVLIEGINRWMSTDEQLLACKYEAYVSPAKYRVTNSAEFGRFLRSGKELVIIDVRPPDEFANKSKDSWRNNGRLLNAINIPESTLKARLTELEPYKDKEIFIYAFSGSADVFSAARTLTENGFTKINVLLGGLFNIRWLAANDKAQAFLNDFVVDVPESNK